jgi:hypothetical protein
MGLWIGRERPFSSNENIGTMSSGTYWFYENVLLTCPTLQTLYVPLARKDTYTIKIPASCPLPCPVGPLSAGQVFSQTFIGHNRQQRPILNFPPGGKL